MESFCVIDPKDITDNFIRLIGMDWMFYAWVKK